ncbi:MAG: NAD-dependent epimerase/dehydratase family protein [Acidobacteria bacterium]|nr:NAD-dependent epimerase/dehydratase family protein [Acidobacteriota bacterium]
MMSELRRLGHKVALFHRSADEAATASEVVRIQGDRNRLQDYLIRLRRFSPDVVVDLILSSQEQARQLMSVANELSLRLIVISSMDVYRAWGVWHEVEPGPVEPLPITEDSPVRTVRTLYPRDTLKMLKSILTWVDEHYDKIAVEEAILSDPEVRATILRLPMVYGPGDPLHRFFPLLKRVTDKRPYVLLPDNLAAWRGPRGYVENIAHAIALAATSERAAGRTYNICEEPSLSELDWQRKIATQANWSGRMVVLPGERTPEHLRQTGNAAQHLVASSERIRAELGYTEVVEVDEAIRRTIAWERQNPPIAVNFKQFDYQAEDAALNATA